MGAVSGDINSLSTFCIDAADLGSRPINAMQSGDRAFVQDRVGSKEGPLFFLDRSSELPVDGVGVLEPLGGVGRWLSEALFDSSGGGGGGVSQAAELFYPSGSGPFWQFFLGNTPAGPVQLYVNGVLYAEGVTYSILGTTVTWSLTFPSAFPLVSTDRVECVYLYY